MVPSTTFDNGNGKITVLMCNELVSVHNGNANMLMSSRYNVQLKLKLEMSLVWQDLDHKPKY